LPEPAPLRPSRWPRVLPPRGSDFRFSLRAPPRHPAAAQAAYQENDINMMPGRSFPHPLARRGTLALLAATLALAAASASAAPKTRPAARKDAPPAVADFDTLSGARARACDAPADPRLAAMGAPTQRECAWSGRIEMQYWRAIPAPGGACLPPAAIAWQRLATTAQTKPAPWNVAWNGQYLVSGNDTLQQALALWRSSDGSWSAVLWRWQPSPRLDTRAWQQAHWKDVVAAAQALGASNRAAPATPLLQAWLDATAATPRVLDGDNWRWVAQHTCLDLQTAGIAQAQLHLPYSRDDARLEQRSAMQVQLARRFPDAEWLHPFDLLDPAVPGKRSGAKFIAVWKEGGSVKGQLWIPLREDGGVVRARIGSELGASPAARSDEAVKQRADLLEHELTALAHAWEARHE
jgi:hypothetical protein